MSGGGGGFKNCKWPLYNEEYALKIIQPEKCLISRFDYEILFLS